VAAESIAPPVSQPVEIYSGAANKLHIAGAGFFGLAAMLMV
jgi:hypothetical protein